MKVEEKGKTNFHIYLLNNSEIEVRTRLVPRFSSVPMEASVQRELGGPAGTGRCGVFSGWGLVKGLKFT